MHTVCLFHRDEKETNIDLEMLKDTTTEKRNLNVSSSIKLELQPHRLHGLGEAGTTITPNF